MSSAYLSQMLMKSCTTMLGIRSYSITVCLPPPIFTGQFFKMFSMELSSNLLPSAAMVFWTMRASGPAYLASRRNRCLRIGYLVIWLFGYLVIRDERRDGRDGEIQKIWVMTGTRVDKGTRTSR